MNMKPMKYAIAFVIYDDDDLPNVWGLPAGSVKNDETFEECVIRSGKEKLGVKLKPTRFIGRDNIERENYILHIEEYETEIISGEPKVHQPIEGVTQYQQWKWGVSSDEDCVVVGKLDLKNPCCNLPCEVEVISKQAEITREN